MTTEPEERPGLTLSNVGGLVAILISLGTLGYTAGVQSNQIARNADDIRDLKASRITTDSKLAEIQDGVTTIRVKLEILLPTPSERKER